MPFVPKFWRRVSDDPEAKAAVIWMAGEYGQDIPDAPYVLESAVGSYSQVEFYAVLYECSVTKCFVSLLWPSII